MNPQRDNLPQPSITFAITEEIRATASATLSLCNAVYAKGNSERSQSQARLLVVKCSTPESAKSLASDLSDLGQAILQGYEGSFEDYWSRQESANACRKSSEQTLAEAVLSIRAAGKYWNPKLHDGIRSVLGTDRLIDLPSFFHTRSPDSEELLAFLAHYLPTCLTDFVSDLARSRLRVQSLKPALKRVAESFLQAFTPERIAQVSLLDSADPLQGSIDQAHDSLFILLGLVIGAISGGEKPTSGCEPTVVPARAAHEAPEAAPNSAEVDGTIPEIRVRVVKDDLRVTVDGTPCSLPGSEKRAVAVLALLGKRTWFSVHDFCRLYFGKQPDRSEARKDFDNPIRRLRSSIPRLTIKAEAGKRQLVGMRIVAVAKRAELEKILARLRDVQISDEDRMIIDKRDTKGR